MFDGFLPVEVRLKKQFHISFTSGSHQFHMFHIVSPVALDLQAIDPHGGHQGLRFLRFVELIDLAPSRDLCRFSVEYDRYI